MGGATLLLLLRGPSTAPVEAPDTLLEAVKQIWDENDLTELIAPLYAQRWPASMEPPMVVVKVMKGRPYLLTSSSSTYWYTLAFTVRDTTEERANARAVVLTSYFDQIGLAWTGGKCCLLTQERWSSAIEKNPGAGNKAAFLEEIEYLTRVQGSR